MTRHTACKLVCGAWAYSIVLGLPLVLLESNGDLQHNSKLSCYFNKIASSAWRISIMIVTVAIILIQVSTYNSLKERLHGALNLRLSLGKIRLYRRAMITSALIAIAFCIGWLPIAIASLMFDWLPDSRDAIVEVNMYFRILFILQGFSNGIIFCLKDVKCCCNRNASRVYPRPETVMTNMAVNKENAVNHRLLFSAHTSSAHLGLAEVGMSPKLLRLLKE